jgi:transposase-like protein
MNSAKDATPMNHDPHDPSDGRQDERPEQGAPGNSALGGGVPSKDTPGKGGRAIIRKYDRRAKAAVYKRALDPDELPEMMPKGVAVAYVCQELSVDRSTLYRDGIAQRIPAWPMTVKRLQDGRLRLSLYRVKKADLLQFVEELLPRRR